MYTVPLHHALMDSCIDHPSEVTARNLTLTAKVVQNMANFAPFGAKEAFMIPCNDFLQSMRPKIISFFDTVSNPKLGAKFERPPRNAARALASIFRYYEANQAVSACDFIFAAHGSAGNQASTGQISRQPIYYL